jgi:hypothetical protein
MAQALTNTETITREALVAELRGELARRANGEISVCRLAADRGIFCHGFRQYTDAELRQRYPWIAKRYPRAPRAEFETLADNWQLARQDVDGLETSCDVQTLEHDGCNGWNDFTNDDLAGFLLDLTGRRVAVVDEPRR